MLSFPTPAPRRRLAQALVCATLAGAGLSTPARGEAATVPSWTPNPAGLVTTPRTCPNPAVATYYDASCWSVAQDDTSPFYWPDAPYAWGQCTYWALEMRPDLWDNQSASDPDPEDWTAYLWPEHAQLEGLTVNHLPDAGSVMVWPKTAENSSGHVAYVQGVTVNPTTGDDEITVQEFNDTTFDDPAQGQGDTMTMAMGAGDLQGVQFIHEPGDSGGVSPTAPAGPAPGAPTSTSGNGTSRSTSASAATAATTTITRKTGATATTASTTRRRTQLTLRLDGRRLGVGTLSPAPLRATVVRLPSYRMYDSVKLHTGTSLELPAGRYRVCVSQSAAPGWLASRACLTRSGASAIRAHLPRLRAEALSLASTALLRMR